MKELCTFREAGRTGFFIAVPVPAADARTVERLRNRLVDMKQHAVRRADRERQQQNSERQRE